MKYASKSFNQTGAKDAPPGYLKRYPQLQYVL